MKKQKYKYIRLFTFLGLIAVLSLQTVWIYNTYMLIRYNIQKDCCEVLEEAVYNLVDNAVKYSKDEGEVEIEITSECSGGYSCIKVRDNGIGFSEEDKRKIFDKFERGSAIKSSRLGKVA